MSTPVCSPAPPKLSIKGDCVSNDEYAIERRETVVLDDWRSKEPWRIYGGSAHSETFGLVAGQGRRGILLDLCMSLPILFIQRFE